MTTTEPATRAPELSPTATPLRTRAQVWHRDERVALVLIVAATGFSVLTGALGPSGITLTLGPRHSVLPPWYLTPKHEPNEWVVTSLVWAAVLCAGVGMGVALRALGNGWRPRPWRLFSLGAVLSFLTILVPPLTSADVLMYAAYGRLQAIGINPYEVTPAEVIRSQFDPVMKWVEFPWTDTPSVYGPIASWSQLLANRLGGTNMHDIVFWLQLLAVVPLLVASAGIIRLAGDDPARAARAALLTAANPLLIWAVVAGAHNEALSVMFGVFGLMWLRRNPFLAGLGIGLAGCAKLSIGLWGIAMVWAYRREPKKLVLLCLGAGLPMGLAYGVWEPHSFFQVLRNGSYVSVGSWANPVYRLFGSFLPSTDAKIVVGVISYLGLFVFAAVLSRVLPWDAAPGLPRGADPRLDPLSVGLRTALLVSVAWLVTAMYTLAWYDLIAWMPLALLPPMKLDRLFVWRSTFLSLAYIPGRAIHYGHSLNLVASRMRDTISPAVQILVLVAIVLWWRRPDRPELLPLRRNTRSL